MRVLVTAASKHGSTAEIAHRIAERLRAHELEVSEATPDVASLTGIDAVVVGSAVYAGRWQSTARSFVRSNVPELRRLRVWAFSSGPVGDPPQPTEESRDGSELAELVHAEAHRTIAGRVDPTQLGLAERAIVRLLGASTDDDRNWNAVDAFADEIAATLDG